MRIGGAELFLIILVALFVIGPDKLPLYAKKLGKALNSLKGTSNILAQEIRENVTEPLQDIVEPLQEVAEPLREITKPIDEATKSLRDIGKPRPKSERTNTMAEEGEMSQGVEDAAETEEPLYDAASETTAVNEQAATAAGNAMDSLKAAAAAAPAKATEASPSENAVAAPAANASPSESTASAPATEADLAAETDTAENTADSL